MSVYEVHNRIYSIDEKPVEVEWASYDFKKEVAAIPNVMARQVLLKTGVMYSPKDSPAIRVSHLLPLDIQGFSALHEELCQHQNYPSCPGVEEIVIESIDEPRLKRQFIAERLRMF